MEETNVLLDTDAALQPMLELAQSCAAAGRNASMIRTVVLKALSDPKVFCGFDELKAVLLPPGVSSSSSSSSSSNEGEAILARTLDLFSYGTYRDYQEGQAAAAAAGPQHFLTLSDTHLFKLRQLTILTLVQKACGCGCSDENTAPSTTARARGSAAGGAACRVPYGTLARELGLVGDKESSATTLDDAVLRQVEELALSCVYARVVAGQLCQTSAALFVSSRHGPPCRPRDVPLSHGAAMLKTLRDFHQGRLQHAKRVQDKRQQGVQHQMDAIGHYHNVVSERTKTAETTSVGGGAGGPVLIGGGSVRGWPAEGQEMGGSARGSSRRQTKRSRGGVGGAMDAFSRC